MHKNKFAALSGTCRILNQKLCIMRSSGLKLRSTTPQKVPASPQTGIDLDFVKPPQREFETMLEDEEGRAVA